MRRIRAIIYRLGFRPKRGSIWHSPTLHLQHASNNYDTDFEEALREELARYGEKKKKKETP